MINVSCILNSVASGLGWALGAALGAKIAAPHKTIMATVGDGAYMFNTPLSAHHTAQSEKLPILIVVFNDSAWTTIKNSTRGSHPKGHTVKNETFPLCDFNHTVAFEMLAESCGGIGMRVEKASEVENVLREAIRLVRSGDRHVLVNVICERG